MIELRPRQKKLKEDIRKAFRKYKRVLAIAPCAFGKTPTAASIMEDAIKVGSKILFIVDREELINQCSETLFKLGINHGVYVRGHKKLNNAAPVQLSSWQTLIRQIKNNSFKFKPNLIIYDEAHRSVAETPKTVLEFFPDAFVIGFTGTPYRNDKTGLGSFYQVKVESCSALDLINENLLIKPKIYHCEVEEVSTTDKVILDDLTEINFNEADKDVIIGADIVRNYQEICKGKQALIFCPTVERAKVIAEKFNKAGISAEFVECHTKNREKLISDFKNNKFKILTNASLLAEGFDHPSLECVILFRKMDSRIMYRQACNRCMRIYKGKTEAYILDFFDNYLEHGHPYSTEKYSLEEDDEVEEISNNEDDEDDEENGPVTCNECQFVYESELKCCPNCGAINNSKIKKIFVEAKKDLVELTEEEEIQIEKALEEKRKKDASPEEKQKEYTRLCVICMEKCKKPRWVDGMYKEKFGVWPNRVKKSPEFVKYIENYEKKESRVSKQLEWKMGLD